MVGRICCDSEGRLNENSILLEGSIRHSQARPLSVSVRAYCASSKALSMNNENSLLGAEALCAYHRAIL